MSELSSNIWKLYVYRAFASMEFFLPVFVIFLLDNSLSITQIMILQSWYYITILALEIPTGAFADRHGRKNAIMISAIIIFIACFVYASGHSFIGFFAAETLWAVGFSFWSGADTAFLYDTLKGLGRENEFKKAYGTYNSISLVFYGIASVIGGFLVVYGLRFPFYLSLIPFGIAIIFPLTLKEPQLFRKVKIKYWNHIKEAVKYTAKHSWLRFIIFYAAIIAIMEESAFFLYQPYFRQIGVPLTSFGIIFTAILLALALGSKLAHRIEPKLGEKTTMLGALLVCAAALLIISRAASFYVIAPVLVLQFTIGLLNPVLLSYMQHHIESYRRATILSLKNMSQSLSIAVLMPVFGAIADYWSIQSAYMISGIMIAAYFVVLAVVFLVFRR
jgi:MFS family permease